ncbi:AbrB/MazE/SpoVT family DNA-binding domain-containing protein [Pirellulaceae bacterium SH449]
MATVQKWGNSLAVRIPHALAGQIEVEEGTSVKLSVRDGELIVRPDKPVRLSLGALLKNCKPSQLHGETDFGDDLRSLSGNPAS